MSKMDLTPVTGAQNISTMNENFQKLEDALNDQVLYRQTTPSEPNQMHVPLDMNGNRIYNLPRPVLNSEPLRVQDVLDAGGTTITLNPEADEVPINPIVGLPGTNVQEALESLKGRENLNIRTNYAVSALPGTAEENANKVIGFDANGQPTVYSQSGGGGGGGDPDEILEMLASTNTTLGSDLVGRVRRGTISRNLTAVMNDDPLSVKDYGAVGDGVTDDTDAIQRALEATVALQKSLFFPAGTYMTRGNTYKHAYNGAVVIFGEGKLLSIIRHMPGYSGNLFNIVNTDNTEDIGPNGLLFHHLWFRGNYPDTYQANAAPYTQSSVYMLTGLVNNFEECRFSHAVYGFNNSRGVLNRFDRCTFDRSEFGYRLFGGFATTSDFNFCEMKDNFSFGLHVDDARGVYMNGGSIENNGRVGAQTAGLFAGNKTGTASMTNYLSRGITVNNVWFETNKGVAAIWLSGGVNTIDNCIFAVQTTSPIIQVTGGQYHIDNALFENEVATHIWEDNANPVLNGNTIRRSYVGGPNRKFPNVAVNSEKTRVEWLSSGGGGGGGTGSPVLGNNVGTGNGFIYNGYRDEGGNRFLDMKTLAGEQGVNVNNGVNTITMGLNPPTTSIRGGIMMPTNNGLQVSPSGVLSYGAWGTLPLNAGWSTFPGASSPARFRKEFDVVRMSGVIQFTSTPPNETVVATLPIGFRPPYGYVGMMTAGGVGVIIDSGTGNVTVSGATSSVVFLDNITFPTT